MRVNMWLQVISAAIVAVVVPTASAGVILSVGPSSQSVAQGSQGTVELNISGLGDPPSLGTFDLNVGFDPTILSVVSFAFGDPLLGDQLDPNGGGNTINFINPGVGTMEVFDLSLDTASTLNSLQASSFALGVLTFDTIGVGVSTLALSINALGDAEGNPLSATIQDGSVNVGATSTIPEPNAVFLLATGLLFIRARRTFRR